MYVRWMGAFGHGGQLSESIEFELHRATPVACEKIGKGKSSQIPRRVGLLVDPKAVYKKFKGDVYSKMDRLDRLYQHRSQFASKSKHTECWAEPIYNGIVIKDASFSTLSYSTRMEILKVLEMHPDLPIYKLKKDQLIEEHI